jgi:menaquinone-specific isochorismate synthase
MIRLDKPGAILQATENTLFYIVPSVTKTDAHLFFSDFWLEKPQWQSVTYREFPKEELKAFLSPNEVLSLRWQASTKENFQIDFNNIQKKIREENWLKAVPSVYEKAQSQEGLFKHSLAHLLQAGGGHIYAYWDETTWFLGLSPEILYEWDGSQIQSVAVAGTTFKGKDISLKDSEKEVFEHRLVIDGITEVLKNFGKVDVDRTETFAIGALQHLRTKIKCAAPLLKADTSVIDALHPTPAVGTYPMQHRREDFKKLLQARPSTVFAAPFGLITTKYHKIIVAIRNLQMLDNEVILTAGCGIVKDSVLEEEWLELEAKKQSIKQRLGLL